MDEYLSEQEQIERIKQWWQDYGWYLVGGMAASALAFYGWNQYQASQRAAAERAQQLYASLVAAVDEDRPDIDALADQLRSEYPSSPYADQAGFLLASNYLIENSGRAAEELRRVVENSADPELAIIARLRLARVLAYREEYDQALSVLAVDDIGRFAARASEIRGDIHVAQSQFEAARAAYLQALTTDGAEGLDRNLVQMKLNDLPSATEGRATEDDG